MVEKPLTLGRYKLLAKLATGGMAEVYLARQTGIEGVERLVVIKRILPHLAEQKRFLDMFLDEARITVKLNHPNIVQTFDLGQEQGEYYIAMEYLEGESLAFLAKESTRKESWPSPELAASMITGICDGLHYAHELCDESGKPLQIIHRDVSPQNIIVLFNGGVKLVDFGVAKAVSKVHQTVVGTMKGKLAYMSPEQCLAKGLDPRADVFSMGVVLWEMLARRRLFRRASEGATIHALINEPLPPIRGKRPEVHPELERIASKALEKKPDDRYPSCQAMAADLREYLRNSRAAVGPAEIAAFMHELFADRVRTKKELLEKLQKSGIEDISFDILKPETSESMPSRSVADQVLSKTSLSALGLDSPGNRAKLWLVSALFAGILVGLGLLFLVMSWNPAPPAGHTDIKGPNKVVDGGSPAKAEADKDAGAGKSADSASMPEIDKPSQQACLLEVKSQPTGCQLLLDDVKVPGKTPMKEVAIKAGVEHQVTVRCTGHLDQTKAVVAGAGQRIRLNFAPKRRAPTRKAKGLLRLDTQPWTTVYLGRRKLGITPLLDIKLSAGRHKLRLVNKEAGRKTSIWVVIRPGKTTSLFKKL
ncbi:MAG: serine/threonine protein kinase [Deltaproteobacteria bacterium]|nr:serine/threonine protein kinase [Deltaproteobacteria bacterium]